MVSVTSDTNILAKAPFAEKLIMKRAGPRDRMSYVCMSKCAAIGRSMSRNMVELPGVLKMRDMPNGTYVVDRCWRWPKNRPCSNYEIASFKYVWGFVHEVKRFLEAGLSQMPRYWMIRDDDTYVNIPHMMEAIARHGGGPPFDPFVERMAWVSSGPCFVCGGAGMVLTGALAVELATAYGDRWLLDQRDGIERKSFYWDTHMPKVIGWIKGAKLIRIPEMSPFSVADTAMCRYRPRCTRTPECDCAPSKKPATWHMSISFNKSVEILSRIP